MAVVVQLIQERGTLTSGRGSIQDIVTNVGWVNDGGPESTLYDNNPLRRPSNGPFTYSFRMFHYFRVQGTHNGLFRPRIKISGNATSPFSDFIVTKQAKLYYRLTDSYSTPFNDFGSTFTYYNNTDISLIPKMSTVGPHTGLQYITVTPPNGTWHTMFLETQLLVEHYDINGVLDEDKANELVFAGSQYAYGNLGNVRISFEIEDFEEADF